MNKKIVIVGAGVAGINAATKLVDNGYPGELITIIDMGKDPYNRLPEEVMTGMLGAGGWSDGKLTYHTAIGGQLSTNLVAAFIPATPAPTITILSVYFI